ncbi:MAG: hypothetical protein ACHQ6T_12105 [Myxococcota bacterium]
MNFAAAAGAERRDDSERVSRGAFQVALLLFAVGAVSRLAPLFDAGGRLLRQFPSEDGYLMLTIARNIALGKGMTVSDGLQPTNGTQPLATLIFAGAFSLAGGDRRLGVLAVLLLEVALACAAAYLLYTLACRLLRGSSHGESMAALLAAAWFASPLVIAHSMNCLESGLYVVAVLCVARVFADSPSPERWSSGRCAAVGALLGLTFWTRNDGVFLVLAACLVHVAWGLRDPAKPLARRIGETIVFGATSLAIAAPWLVFNRMRFGAIVPVSGQSEALEAKLGENLWKVPNAVFEYATLYLPIPNSLEESRWIIAVGVGACAAVGALAVRVLRTGPAPARAITWLGAIFGLCLLSFYGVSFGAGYFFSRYVFPLSPFFALLWGALLRRGWEESDSRGWRVAPAAAGLALLAFAVGLDGRLYRNGTSHMHFQVVDWVSEHVPEDVWVAAPQSGTLGFFHDRTINLDGKVNPAALAVRRADGASTRYVLEQRQIEYLADWEGLASWATQPRIAAEFDLIVDDPERNLAVLRRRDGRVGG